MIDNSSTESRDALDTDFSRYIQILKSRWLLIALLWGGTIGLAGIAASLKPPVYEATTKLLVRIDPTSTLTGVGQGVGNLESLVKAQNPLTTEVELITSKPVIERVIQSLELKDETGQLVDPESFEKGLTVKIVGGADVLNLTYQDSNPQTAAAVVNELAKVYIESNVLENLQQTSKAVDSLKEQLPESQSFVQQAETDLRRFREENQIISLDEESQSIVAVLENLDLQLSEAQATLSAVSREAAALQDSLGVTVEEAIALSDISQSTSVQTTLQELQAVERQKALQQGIYTEQSPVVLTASSQEAALRQILNQEVEKVLGGRSTLATRSLQIGSLQQSLISKFLDAELRRLSLASRVESLAQFRNRYRERANSLPVLEQQQAELEQTLRVARSSYQEQLSRLKELEAAEKQDIGNATVIEPASVPESSISGGRSAILALGGLFGAFLATTVVTLLTLRDESRLQQRQQHPYLPGTAGSITSPAAIPPPPRSSTHSRQHESGGKSSAPSGKR